MGDQFARIYEFGPFRIDARARILLHDGKSVPLTPKAFDTLLVLVESDGQVVERDVLIEKVWPDSFVEEGNLKVTVFKLRKALGEAGGDDQYLEAKRLRDDSLVLSVMGSAYAKMGDSLRAKQMLKELEQMRAPPDYVANIYANLGETERAFELLRKALAERTTLFLFIKVDPAWDNLRRDPRFLELFKEAGLQDS